MLVAFDKYAMWAALSEWVQAMKPVRMEFWNFMNACQEFGEFTYRPRLDDQGEYWIDVAKDWWEDSDDPFFATLYDEWVYQLHVNRVTLEGIFEIVTNRQKRIAQCHDRLKHCLNFGQLHLTDCKDWKSYETVWQVVSAVPLSPQLSVLEWANLVYDVDRVCSNLACSNELVGRPSASLEWMPLLSPSGELCFDWSIEECRRL
jgi:hypothetical protein